MKRNNYINIQGWMITDLDLSGNELIAYALVYGFSQDGLSSYKGSISYISRALNVTDRTAIRVMSNLCKKGLIKKMYSKEKKDKGTALYQTIISQKRTHDKMSEVVKDPCQNVHLPMTNCPNTTDKMSYNNNKIIIDKNKLAPFANASGVLDKAKIPEHLKSDSLFKVKKRKPSSEPVDN